tara:strand:+ start:42 stop:242 length:201 start_codon:yes stop_codon:yes gene_type:complete
MGNVYELEKKNKEDIKSFALFAVAIIGTLYVLIQFYFYRVAKKWSTQEFLFNYLNKKKYAVLRMSA